MKSLVFLLPALLCLPPLSGAPQVVNVNGGTTPILDTRPFGKYLVQVCRISPGAPVTCPAPPDPSPAVPFPPPPASYPVSNAQEPTPQTITIKQEGCLPGIDPCPAAVYPLTQEATFFVSAKSDSGLPVTQVVSSNATPPFGTGTVRYLVTGPGPVVIQAFQAGNAQYAAATPVDLILQVADANEKKSCSLLPAPAPTQVPERLDLASIITLMGTPTPFVLTAQGTNTILIYSNRYPLSPHEKEVLHTIPAGIAALASRSAASLGIAAPPKPFKVELEIPHAAALGDLASRINALNNSGFTVQGVGSDRVRVSAPAQPDCDSWTAFLTSIRRLEWHVTPEPFAMKLYYLSSTDAVTAFTSLAGAASGSAGTPAAASPPASSGGPGAASSPSGSATIAITQPAGSAIDIRSDTTPCVIAGLASGNSNGCAPGSAAAGAATAATPAAASSSGAGAPKPPAMAAMGVVAGTAPQNPSDLLVFSDSNPGDEAQILERKRILAQLDLPRPEMLINAWVMQNSTANSRAIGEFSSTIKDLVGTYNGAIETVVLRGWTSVKTQTATKDFFDKDFYGYIADRYVADAEPEPAGSAASPAKIDPQKAAQQFLDTSGVRMADSEENRRRFGICPRGRYCLGYNALFQPLKPRLTDFLLTLIAADHPFTATEAAIDAVQGNTTLVTSEKQCDDLARGPDGSRELRDRCRAIWTNLGMGRELPPQVSNCVAEDNKKILGSLSYPDNAPVAGDTELPRPRIFLGCFYEAAYKYMRHPGLLRAAIADFLFHYKMSQQYPHEFLPYDLSQSADTLNSALGPLIDAFNRDIIAFQVFMRADVQYQVERLNSGTDQRCCMKRLFGLDKPSFYNDGIVSVRTISGQPTSVNTTSQSTLNASSAPTLSQLMNGLANPGGSSSGTSPLASVLGTPPANVALLAGALSAYQTTYAQIGRGLSLQVQPRSLSTASSAELFVTLTAAETAGGPTFTGGAQGGASQNMSRVANHDMSTRIRVESVKLFEVSSFSAVVERSKSRFPLLPPFVEIPYVGTILGIPLPAAKEYHSSTAIISAMVVPTAADLAYGLRFAFDQVLEGDGDSCSFWKGSAGSGVTTPCVFRRAVSLRDLNKSPIRSFHKYMTTCLATQMKSPFLSVATLPAIATLPAAPNPGACRDLKFDTVPRDAF